MSHDPLLRLRLWQEAEALSKQVRLSSHGRYEQKVRYVCSQCGAEETVTRLRWWLEVWPVLTALQGHVLSVNCVFQLTLMRLRGWGRGLRSSTWITLDPLAWRSSCPYQSSSRIHWCRGSLTSSTPTETGRLTSKVSVHAIIIIIIYSSGIPPPELVFFLSSRVHRRRLPVQRQRRQRAEITLWVWNILQLQFRGHSELCAGNMSKFLADRWILADIWSIFL